MGCATYLHRLRVQHFPRQPQQHSNRGVFVENASGSGARCCLRRQCRSVTAGGAMSTPRRRVIRGGSASVVASAWAAVPCARGSPCAPLSAALPFLATTVTPTVPVSAVAIRALILCTTHATAPAPARASAAAAAAAATTVAAATPTAAAAAAAATAATAAAATMPVPPLTTTIGAAACMLGLLRLHLHLHRRRRAHVGGHWADQGRTHHAAAQLRLLRRHQH
jgi:hypothetical protein